MSNCRYWCSSGLVSELSRTINVACNHSFPRMVVSSTSGSRNDPLNYVARRASDTKYSPLTNHASPPPLLCRGNSQVSDDVMYASISHTHSLPRDIVSLLMLLPILTRAPASGITGWTQRVGLANRLPQKEK